MNRIFCVGDIHKFFEFLLTCNRYVDSQDIIIQVGDFGITKNIRQEWARIGPSMKCPVWFIDGNHEDFSIINSWSKTEKTEVANNLFYVPRGYVTTIFGKRIGFLGGAESLDKTWRTPGHDWFPSERVTQEDVNRLVQNVGKQPLDILITHTPPTFAIKANFPPINLSSWSLPKDWEDVSSQMVEESYVLTNPKRLLCGHMHKSIVHDNVQMLDINEITVIE